MGYNLEPFYILIRLVTVRRVGNFLIRIWIPTSYFDSDPNPNSNQVFLGNFWIHQQTQIQTSKFRFVSRSQEKSAFTDLDPAKLYGSSALRQTS